MPYLTATEAAARARVSPNTIYRRVKDGSLKEHREGTRPRYLDRDIDALFHPDKVKAPPGPCRIIAVANQKGGVGKTTTTANLSAVIAAEGYRVLAIDCDPQGSLTTVLGVDATKLDDTLYNVLIDRLALEKATKRPILALDTLSLVGGNIRLSAAERELLGALRREERLNQAISPHLAEYDFIFLDTPPNLGLLTLNALVAAHEVIIPVDMAPLAILGLDSLMDTIRETQTNYPGLSRARPLFSRVERTNLSQEIEAQINTQFGEDVFKSQIRSTVRAKEAQYSQQPISLFRPSDPLVADYYALAQEVIHG